MPIQTLQWNDGTGDKIYIEYDEASGDQLAQVSSDPNLTNKSRGKNITFTATGEDGSISQSLHITQLATSPTLPDGKHLVLVPSTGSSVVPADGHNIMIDCLLREYQSGVVIGEERVNVTTAKLTAIDAFDTSLQVLIGVGQIVWVYGSSRGAEPGPEASYKLKCTYLTYSAEIVVYQEENKIESTEELSPVPEIALPEWLTYNIPAEGLMFDVTTTLRRRFQDVYTSGGKGPVTETLESNVPDVTSSADWATVSGKRISVASRGTEEGVGRYVSLTPLYNNKTGTPVLIWQNANALEDINILSVSSLYINRFESSGGGLTLQNPLPAYGAVITLTIELRGNVEYIYSSEEKKVFTDAVIPEEFITYRMESNGHFAFNDLSLILRCYNRDKSEGQLYTAEIFAMCKGIEVGGNFIFQSENVKLEQWFTKMRAVIYFKNDDDYGSITEPFKAGGSIYSDAGVLLDWLPIGVYAKVETYEELEASWSSGAHENLGEERIILSEPVTNHEEIYCEGAGAHKWEPANSPTGLYTFEFESRGKVEGPQRSATIYVERAGRRYPGELLIYQEENVRAISSVTARYHYRFEAFNAVPEDDPGNAVYFTKDENGIDVLNYHVNATYGMLKFRVFYDEEERFFYTSWEYDVEGKRTRKEDAPFDMTHPDFKPGSIPGYGTIPEDIMYEHYHIVSNTIQNYSIPPGTIYGWAMYPSYLLNTPEEKRYLRLVRFDNLEDQVTPEGEMIIIPGTFWTSPPSFLSLNRYDEYINYIRITREANELKYSLIVEEAVLLVNGLSGTVSVPPAEGNHTIVAFCPANVDFTSGAPAPVPVANVDLEIQISAPSWCNYYDGRLTVLKNNSIESRTAIISAVYKGQLVQTITVVQQGAPLVQASVISITGQENSSTGEISLSQIKIKVLNSSSYVLHFTASLTIQTGGLLTDPIVGYQATSADIQEDKVLTYSFSPPRTVYDALQATIKLSLNITTTGGALTQIEDLGVVNDYFGPHIPQEPE